MSAYGQYSHALVSRVPNSIVNAQNIGDPIKLYDAVEQHNTYVNTLKACGLTVIELPADEQFPDSVYVEDPVVIIDGVALICKIGHPTREDEVIRVRKVLRELGVPCLEITDPKAVLDGGDVRFTGREILVGISKDRTNYCGVKALEKAFPQYPVVAVRVPDNLLHFTGCMSMVGPDVMCISSTPEGQEIQRAIKREANFNYRFINVAVNTGANTLLINDNLVHRSEYPDVIDVFNKEINCRKIPTKMWELSKPHANLSCMSVLFNINK